MLFRDYMTSASSFYAGLEVNAVSTPVFALSPRREGEGGAAQQYLS
jgi:hypothetical protein